MNYAILFYVFVQLKTTIYNFIRMFKCLKKCCTWRVKKGKWTNRKIDDLGAWFVSGASPVKLILLVIITYYQDYLKQWSVFVKISSCNFLRVVLFLSYHLLLYYYEANSWNTLFLMLELMPYLIDFYNVINVPNIYQLVW